jgi:hypothetical protein
MPNNSVRVDVVLDYEGRGWGTIQVDLSPREGDRTEVDLVEPFALERFGLETPDALPCLSRVEVFATRATHDWPPVLEPPAFWNEPFAALAEEVKLPIGRLEDAVREAKAFIDAVAGAE